MGGNSGGASGWWLGKRVGVLAYQRLGKYDCFSTPANDQEVSTELMMLCKRRHADTPTRRTPTPCQPPDLLKTLTAYATLELDPASAGITKSTRN